MVLTGFAIGVGWVFASAVLVVAAWLVVRRLDRVARDERGRRGRLIAFAAVMTAVGVGATWVTHGSASATGAVAAPAAAHRAHIVTGATLLAAVHRHQLPAPG